MTKLATIVFVSGRLSVDSSKASTKMLMSNRYFEQVTAATIIAAAAATLITLTGQTLFTSGLMINTGCIERVICQFPLFLFFMYAIPVSDVIKFCKSRLGNLCSQIFPSFLLKNCGGRGSNPRKH